MKSLHVFHKSGPLHPFRITLEETECHSFQTPSPALAALALRLCSPASTPRGSPEGAFKALRPVSKSQCFSCRGPRYEKAASSSSLSSALSGFRCQFLRLAGLVMRYCSLCCKSNDPQWTWRQHQTAKAGISCT